MKNSVYFISFSYHPLSISHWQGIRAFRYSINLPHIFFSELQPSHLYSRFSVGVLSLPGVEINCYLINFVIGRETQNVQFKSSQFPKLFCSVLPLNNSSFMEKNWALNTCIRRLLICSTFICRYFVDQGKQCFIWFFLYWALSEVG